MLETLEPRVQCSTTLPTSIAGYTFDCVVESGKGGFADKGSRFELVVSSTGKTYQIEGSTGVANSYGSIKYQKTSAQDGTFRLDDKRLDAIGDGTFKLTGDDDGTYKIAVKGTDAKSDGTFIMHPPAPTVGVIVGTVYLDRNHNGHLDRRDNTLSGQVVWIDVNGDGKLSRGEKYVRTSADGDFTFKNLKRGRYRVAVRSSAGYANPDSQNLLLRAGQTSTTVFRFAK